jgi:hypothetical protein
MGAKRVIILEEDLQIAPDFFSFFAGVAPLLDTDPTLLGETLRLIGLLGCWLPVYYSTSGLWCSSQKRVAVPCLLCPRFCFCFSVNVSF